MNGDDFSDPTDWNSTSLPSLSSLDSNLRCLICKEFYTAPVITSCLHTFCSLCIRRSLSVESVCPACKTTNISDSGLRQNKIVAELVENFKSVRPQLLDLATKKEVGTSSEKSIRSGEQVQEGIAQKVIEEVPVKEPTLEPGIRCPICNKQFKTEQSVDLHIDTCTGPPQSSSQTSYNLRPPKQPLHPLPTSSNTSNSSQPRSSDISTKTYTNPLTVSKPHTLTPLPKVNYALLNETKLRSLLQDMRLPTWGNKAILAARHKEYVNLYNANIDLPVPRPTREIIAQLERWMAVQQQIQIQSRMAAASVAEKRKEFDGGEWQRKNKNDFAALARQAKESTKRRKVVEEEKKEEEQQHYRQEQLQDETNGNQVIKEYGLGKGESILIDETILIESSQDEAWAS